MSTSNNIDKVLKRNGTGQGQRFIDALKPEAFKLYDFTIEDWILFAYNFAENINYFSTTNSEVPAGNWQGFFKDLKLENTSVPKRDTREYSKLKEAVTLALSQYKDKIGLTPHLTLFVCFLQLLEFSKTRFNALTKRHLDFYYNEILQVDKLAATPDQVHVLFELAKKSSEEQIIAETALNAKKDQDGKPMLYKTKQELIVNKANVGALKTVYNGLKYTSPDFKGTNPYQFKASTVANTLDGIKTALPEKTPYWYPFGYTGAEQNFTELNDAEIGFSIASPMLYLQEGSRTVAITIDFTEEKTKENEINLSDFTANDILRICSVYGSGEKDWVGPLGFKTNTEDGLVTEIPTNNQLKLVFRLDKDTEALVNYNEETLLKKYNTNFPIVRFLLDTKQEKGHRFYRAIVGRVVSAITVKVEVKEAVLVSLENDNGVLKSSKPFYPFTTQPVKSSNFYINYPEVFSKNWESIDLKLKWKNTPDDFKDWYAAYVLTQKLATNKSVFQTALGGLIEESELIVKNNEHFKAQKALLHKEEWNEEALSQVLFSKAIDPETNEETGAFESVVQWTNNALFAIDKSGPIRLSLQQSFLHELYPRIYALALTSDNDILIPNEPYTPIVESVSLNYVAQETITIHTQTIPVTQDNPLVDTNTQSAYIANRIQLFHEHPFGQNEAHNYLKTIQQIKGVKTLSDTNTITTSLVPKYCLGGALFIGLEHAEVSQTINLLIQVLEGSENPVVPSFETNEKIEWAVLCDNKWKSLKEYIVSNNTDNFLKSGIITISIPKEATKTNTQLPSGFIWIQAKMHRDYDAVCKVINIHTQAVLSEFINADNNLSHLEKGLPKGTIKKMITRKPQVKSVDQPYNSFKGIPKETDALYYRRISERLRHKNRAISLWDYEHLILQKFSEIYKVKCLNHTTDTNFVAAGEVTIVVIPDTVNKNVFDIYEPRLSKALTNKVESYINALNTMHVNAKVINPNYEQVTVTLEAQFYEGLDASFYIKKLEEDIIKFLSPWAFDTTKEITFGITLHRSVLIDYLEKLEYVDYLQNVTMDKEGAVSHNLTPSSPKSILVSAKKHKVTTVLTTCKGEKTEAVKVCQF